MDSRKIRMGIDVGGTHTKARQTHENFYSLLSYCQALKIYIKT